MKTRPKLPVTTPKTRERRNNVRVPIKVAATIVDGDGTKVYGWVVNVSMSGMYFEGTRQFPPETHVSLHLMFRSDQMEQRNLYIRGWVAHTRGKGMGIQFQKPLDEEKTRVFERLIEQFSDPEEDHPPAA